MDRALKLSVYGKNLKDEVTIGGDTQLPDIFAGGPLAGAVFGITPGPNATFSPLNKGRIIGFEAEYSF
jgi:iron complex outermembrane receptor protein